MRRFIAEFHRRRVFRVAGVYVVVVWMAVEIALTSFEVLELPGWSSTLVLVLALLGFPVVVALAWAFDLTAHGIVRTAALPEDDAGPPEPAPRGQPGHAKLAGALGVGVLVALVGFGAYARLGPGHAARSLPHIESLAVLPFADLSASHDQGYFADGIAEELLNRLARVPDLQVAARTSSFAFKSSNLDMSEIARRLRVDAVLEGSVRRDGENVRVTAQLVNAANGYQIWSETYDRRADGILAVQDDIARSIVDALSLQLAPTGLQPVRGTASVRAHDFYLLGLGRWHRRTRADLMSALEYFNKAVAEDPSFALAHAGVAQTYAVLPYYAEVPKAEAIEKAVAAAARALALDPFLAEGHAALGQVAQSLEWDLAVAEEAYRRAVQYNPNYATGYQWHAETLIVTGRLREARSHIDRALALDPLSPVALHTKAVLLTVQRDYGGAESIYRDLLARQPDFALGWLGRLLNALAARQYDVARLALSHSSADEATRAALERALDRLVDPARVSGDPLASLDDALPPAQLALWAAALGQRERAAALLERAYADGSDPSLPFYLVHPLAESTRRDARVRAITARLGIEPAPGRS